MRARSLTLLGAAVVAIAVLALGFAGIVDLSAIGIGRRATPEGVASPEEAEAAERTAAGLAGVAGARVKKPGAKEGVDEPAAPPPMPSEVSGTSPTGGALRGRVVRSDVKVPVEGAIVRLTRPDSLFHYLRAKREGRYDDLTARTDANGRFAMKDVVPADSYAIVAREGSGAAVTKLGISLQARQQKDLGDLVVGPSGGLGGRVIDGAGQGIAAVRVAVTWQVRNDFQVVIADPDTLPWIEAETKTDVEGRWALKALEPGDKTVIVKAPSGASDVATPITVTAGEQRNDVDVTLSGALALGGKVVWKGGAPIEGARVFAKADRKPSAWSMETGPDGVYRIGGLLEGKYALGALVPGIPIKVSDGHMAGEESNVIEFEAVGALSGTVVSKATRKPIPRFRVDAKYTGPLGGEEQYITAQLAKILGATPFEGRDGAFRFDRLREGPYLLTVEAEGFPKTTIEKPVAVAAGSETTGVVIEVAEGNGVTGLVLDSTGPVSGARVFVVPDADLKNADPSHLAERVRYGDFESGDEVSRTDDAGAFDTGPLTPRVYALLAVAEGRLPASLGGVDLRRGGRGDVRLTLPRCGGVKAIVFDHRGRRAKGVGVVAVTAESKDMFDTGTKDDGTCELKPLAEGRWVVIRRSPAVQSVLQGRTDMATQTRVEAVTDPRERYDRLRHLGGEEVDVRDAKTPAVTIRLPRLATVHGRVTLRAKPYAEEWIWVIDEGGLFVGSTQTDKEGRFTLDHVEAGPARVYVNVAEKDAPQDWQLTPVSIPDAEDATIEINR